MTITANPQTGTSIISSSLRLVGSLASGEVPTASELNDAGMILTEMIDAWQIERLMVPFVARITNDSNNVPFTLVANKQSYQLGANAPDFNYPRPARLERVSVMYSAAQATPSEFPLEMLDDVAWQGVVNKTTVSLLPQVCFNDLAFPIMTLWFWPPPTQANPIVLYAWQPIQNFADLITQYSFPPAYQEAIRYNLAVRLAAEFPGDPQKMPLVMKIANESLARIRSFNLPMKEVSCDEGILGDHLRGNIYSGTPNRSHRY
jgi:hypothetical protein